MDKDYILTISSRVLSSPLPVDGTSIMWQSHIMYLLDDLGPPAIMWVGPVGEPMIARAYISYLSAADKLRGDEILRSSGIGEITDEKPLVCGPYATVFARPRAKCR